MPETGTLVRTVGNMNGAKHREVLEENLVQSAVEEDEDLLFSMTMIEITA